MVFLAVVRDEQGRRQPLAAPLLLFILSLFAYLSGVGA